MATEQQIQDFASGNFTELSDDLFCIMFDTIFQGVFAKEAEEETLEKLRQVTEEDFHGTK